MSLPSRLSAIALLACITFAPSYADQAFDPPTRSAIRDVIAKQLKALAQDDAAAAESFAAPGIKKRFPEPAKFLDMVKSSYAALVKPRSTEFGETLASPHGTAQKVTVVAADGTIWSAVYLLEKSEEGWRINGCGLTRLEGEQAI